MPVTEGAPNVNNATKARMGSRKQDLSQWPRYEAAVRGLRNYWYPVTWAGKIGRRPMTFRVCGDPVMLHRANGKVHALYDQCPHRGIPLSVGLQEFPGTWSCRYHGWTFDLETGILKAALTDGPDSRICGKVRVRTYPVEVRAGLVFIWMGQGEPVPVESDIPSAFLGPKAVIVGRVKERKGNWRLAAENGYDEGHAKMLHRYGALMTLFSRIPGWATTRAGGAPRGDWLTRVPDDVGLQGDYPGLGVWPKFKPWQRPRKRPGERGSTIVSIRLPGALEVTYGSYNHYTWYEPVDESTHRYFQFLVKDADGRLDALSFRLRYWLWRRWIFHVQFNNQDARMVELMPDTPPERFFRPDASITAWRRLCEHARGDEVPVADLQSHPAAPGGDSTTEQHGVADARRAQARIGDAGDPT
jgi:nitrite reductase/ring-hydroxylating ferredoxin subunit